MIFLKEQVKYFDKIKEINKEINNIDEPKVYIETFGCNLNENDSEKILGILEKSGYTLTMDAELAHFIIFNTCCIRENAENKLFGRLGEVKRYAENGAVVALCGCMMQEIHMVEKVKRSYPFVRLIFGTHTLYKLPENLYYVLENKNNKVFDIEDVEGSIFEGIPTLHKHSKTAFVPIIYGCNNFCTYCIVPYVRGRERSREPEEILKEIKELVEEGYVEVTLLGQNVNSYSSEHEISNFAKLLEEVAKIEGLEKIRFLSPHPKDFTEDVAKVIRDNKNISRNLHYPLQSGSTKVLKEMNRVYTKEEYLEKAAMIRELVPDVVFSTDIIVGFPGESEEDFLETLDVVRMMDFEQIFMFIYSPRVGTIAAKRDDQIDKETSSKRFKKLQDLYGEMVMKKNESYIGKVFSVIIEEETGDTKIQNESEENAEENSNESNISNENNLENANKNIVLDKLKARTDSNKIVILPKYEGYTLGDKIDVEILVNRKWYFEGRKLN